MKVPMQYSKQGPKQGDAKIPTSFVLYNTTMSKLFCYPKELDVVERTTSSIFCSALCFHATFKIG